MFPFFSNVNRINFLYYCVVCLCIISIGNFAMVIKPRAFSVWLTCHHLLFDVQRYGRLVRYQTPHFCYLQRIFSSSLPQSEIGYSWKDSLLIVWCSDFLSLPSFKHVKRQSDDGYAGMTLKKLGFYDSKSLKKAVNLKSRINSSWTLKD